MVDEIQNLCNNYNPVVDNGLIILADISGFTGYINASEIEHSQKNVARLLEAMIDSNELGLSVSEIEGDAILFFKFGDNYSFAELINQIKFMTKNFNSTLNELSSNINCNCGACNVLSHLHIKFIIHIGRIGTIMIKNFCKLYGIDIIAAHRLLKNHLPIDYYALFTNKTVQKFAKEIRERFLSDSDFIKDKDAYNDINTIDYYYIPLKKLLQKNFI